MIDIIEEPSKQQIVRNELEQIWNDRRRLTPSDVVEVASDTAHPLHSFFEWDDSEAAQRYRLLEAGALIRSVKVHVTQQRNDEVEDLVIRKWISTHHAGAEIELPAGYIPEAEAREQPEVREAVLRRMQRELSALHRRYRHLHEYWALVDDLRSQRDEKAS